MLSKSVSSKEEEEIVLSSIMIGKDEIYKINLKPEDFYFLKNQKIFRAMCSLRDKRKPIDLVSLGSELGEELKSVGGHSHIAYLSGRAPVTLNIKHHAKEVKSLSYRRELMDKSYRLIKEAESGGDIERCKRDLVDTGLSNLKIKTISELMDKYHEEYSKPIEYGIMTGIQKIDDETHGFRGGEFITVGADTAGGKSMFILNIIVNALKADKKVMLVNLEMSNNEVLERLLTMYGKLNPNDLRNREKDDKTMDGLAKTFGELAEKNLKIITTGSVTSAEIRQQAYIEKMKDGLDLLVVDYIGLISDDKKEIDNLGIATKNLKSCSMDLNIPVITPYQTDKRSRINNSTPRKEDAKGSTEVPNAASIIFAIQEIGDDKVLWLLKNRSGREHIKTQIKLDENLIFRPIDEYGNICG